jgi:hypothetical protein
MEITDNTAARNVYLICHNIFDIFVHYLACPIMLLLLFSGEIEYDSAIPYSTIFCFLLGLAVGLSQTFGSRIYCGGIWFNPIAMLLINLVYHVLFVLWHRKIYRKCCKSKKPESVASDVDEREASTKSETEKGVDVEVEA